MAITDLQVSDTLETSAPSIKYEGNEGPQSPQQEQQVAQLKREYMQYVFEQKDLQEPVMSFEEWYQAVYEASRMGVQAPQEEITTEEVMRAPAAYGGIMDVGGRRRYGIGSRLRKLIPNELARVAEVAAPFVAPFNPLIGGLMGGIGAYDRTGKLGSSALRGLGTYGLGQGARWLGGAGFQQGIDPRFAGGEGLGRWAQSPIGKETGLKMGNWKMFGGEPVSKTSSAPKLTSTTMQSSEAPATIEQITEFNKVPAKTLPGKNLGKISEFINKNSTAILLGSMGLAYATAKPEDVQDAMKMSRGTGLDIDKIRAEVQEALAGGEEAWALLQKKYPYIGEFSTKKAEGGRIGLYAGGQSIPSDYTMEDARKTSMQDKMGGITEIMKQADLSRKGDVGQMYAAEGGLMDLGGMEKDYRNDGGFVPIGGEEKADDVPARLSKNEFVFTADAVRGAGGGDIDKGAEIMENIMKNLEQGGQISEETQGLTGAQEMFGVSERLSEVI